MLCFMSLYSVHVSVNINIAGIVEMGIHFRSPPCTCIWCTHSYIIHETQSDMCLYMYIVHVLSAAGMVTMISAPDSGSTVVSWSPPNPPNGVILYYNIRINNSDNGDLVAFIEEQNVTSIDVAEYGESGGKYTVEVKDTTCIYIACLGSNHVVHMTSYVCILPAVNIQYAYMYMYSFN